MTKPKEPSKALIQVWYNAITEWENDENVVDARRKACAVIQRHVDREVRKAVKRQAEVVRCAKAFVDALKRNYRNSTCDTRINMTTTRVELIAAVKAMKEGKK